jgi:hypothetical protein
MILNLSDEGMLLQYFIYSGSLEMGYELYKQNSITNM